MTRDEVFGNDDVPESDDGRYHREDQEFVLDEWDDGESGVSPQGSRKRSLEGMFESGAQPASAGAAGHDYTEEDELFGGDTDLRRNVLGEDRTFAESGDRGWDGSALELEELGVDMTDKKWVPPHLDADGEDLFDFSAEDELTLVDDESQAAGAGRFGSDLADGEPASGFDLGFDEGDDVEELEGEDASGFDLDFESDDEDALAEEDPLADGVAGELDAEFEEFAGDLGADLVVGRSRPAGEWAEDAFEDDLGDGEFDETVAEGEDLPIDYNTRDFEVAEDAQNEEWAPVSQFEPGEEEEETDAVGDEYAEAIEEDPDFSDYEAAYYDQTHEFTPVAKPRSNRFRAVASVAAGLLIAAAAGYWYLKPDDLESSPTVAQIDVVKVGRPNTGTTVKDPRKGPTGTKTPVKGGAGKGTGSEGTQDPVAKDPLTQDPTTKDPTTKDPVAKDPTTKDPTTKDPVATSDPIRDPGKGGEPTDPTRDPTPVATKDPTTDPHPTTDPGRVVPTQGDKRTDMTRVGGDGTAVSKRDDDIMDRHRRETVQEFNGLIMGSQALAQLTNDNIFVGRVKSLNAACVTLRTTEGEVTLDRSRVRTLTTLDGHEELEEWKKALATGFVRLRNSNRLKGKIVETRDDAVILMVNANRVVIPTSAIDSVSTDSREGVNLTAEEAIESDDWFRKLVERRMLEQENKTLDLNKSKTAAPGK